MYVYYPGEHQRPLESYLVHGIGVSLLVHLMAALLFLTSYSHPPAPVPVFEVTLAPIDSIQPNESSVRHTQIVTEPQSKEVNRPPQSVLLEAEKNRGAEREQIKRGVDPEAGATLAENPSAAMTATQPSTLPRPSTAQPPTAVPEQEQNQRQTPPQTESSSSAPDAATERAPINSERAPRLSQLRLDPATLIETFGEGSNPAPTPRQSATSMQSLAGYQAFSRPRGSGARFLGEQGAADHLPNLPDGDITLLNTKANKFAVFVRRVATQVFGELRKTGWQSLAASDVRRIADFSTVRAVLSPEGELLDVQLISPSGSIRFDEVLSLAVRQGARDPHPPREAAAGDGNIRFVFKARTWTRFAPSGPGGAISERRWLLLGTGLE